MKRAALMTIFQVPNYGSLLQTFATQTVLEKAGYSCDVISYLYPNAWHFARGSEAVRPNLVNSFRSMLRSRLGFRHHPDYMFRRFRRDYLHLTAPFADHGALERADWTGYDTVVAGSDQIWNPRFLLGDPAFMLSFTPDSVRRISLASSFASATVPASMRESYIRALKRFEALSVREEGGQRVIHDVLGLDREVRLLLDPTLLLSAPEWEQALQLPRERVRKGRYLLLYVLDYAFEPRPLIMELARRMAEKLGCDEIVTFSASSSPEAVALGATSVRGCSVNDFVRYFRDAEGVVTSSFHGTAFAVNFSRPLGAVTSPGADDRQMSLLCRLGLERCAIPSGGEPDNLVPIYNTEETAARLELMRQSDMQWITESL